MPHEKNKGGRPSKTPYLERFLPDIKRMAFFGYTLAEITETLGDVCSETVRKFMQEREIRIGERLHFKHITKNSTPENLKALLPICQRHVEKWQVKYGAVRDGKNGRRFRTNSHKVSADTIEAHANVILAKVLNEYDPDNPTGATIETYAEAAFRNGMNNIAREGYEEVKTMNLTTYGNSGATDGHADNITGKELGIENMLAVDQEGNNLGLMGGKGFEAMVLDSGWSLAPHVTDKRVFHCFDCHTDYTPRSIDKTNTLSPKRYACPFCGGKGQFYAGFGTIGPRGNVYRQRKKRETWAGFLVLPYNIIEGPPNTSPTIHLDEEDHYDGTFSEVRPKEESVARRVLRKNFLRNNWKLLWYQPQPCVAPVERL